MNMGMISDRTRREPVSIENRERDIDNHTDHMIVFVVEFILTFVLFNDDQNAKLDGCNRNVNAQTLDVITSESRDLPIKHKQLKNEQGSHRSRSLHVVAELQHTEFVKIATMIHQKYVEIRNRVNTEVLEWAVATISEISGERF